MLIGLYFWLWILLQACVSLFLKWLYISSSQIFIVLFCRVFSGNASMESNGPDSSLGVSPIRAVSYISGETNCLFQLIHFQEEEKPEGSLILKSAADKRLLLSKHINLMFSYKYILPVTQDQVLSCGSLCFRTQGMSIRRLEIVN